MNIRGGHRFILGKWKGRTHKSGIGHLSIAEITRLDISTCLSDVRKRSPSQAHHALVLLSTIFKWARAMGYVDINPAEGQPFYHRSPGGAVEERTERDWRKVRYLYMDARRLANRRSLIVRGPQKIYDPTVAHIGMLLATQAGDPVFRRYHDAICERFWRRELDIENAAAIRAVLVETGADGRFFDELIASGEGARQCRAIVTEAEERGVFGVPTFVLDESGELFWGTDRIWMLRERLVDNVERAKP